MILVACISQSAVVEAVALSLVRQCDSLIPSSSMPQKHQAATVLASLCRHGYLQSLPQQGELLPIFWTDEELRGLTGTELEGKAEADRSAAITAN